MKRKLFMMVLLIVALIIATLVLVSPVFADSNGTPVPSDLVSRFLDLADGWKLVTLAALVFTVLTLGVLNALLKGELLLRRLWDISQKRIIPGVVGYFALCFTGAVNDDLRSLAVASFAVFTAVLAGDILANSKELGVPFPLPDSLTKFLTGSGPSGT